MIDRATNISKKAFMPTTNRTTHIRVRTHEHEERIWMNTRWKICRTFLTLAFASADSNVFAGSRRATTPRLPASLDVALLWLQFTHTETDRQGALLLVGWMAPFYQTRPFIYGLSYSNERVQVWGRAINANNCLATRLGTFVVRMDEWDMVGN